MLTKNKNITYFSFLAIKTAKSLVSTDSSIRICSIYRSYDQESGGRLLV